MFEVKRTCATILFEILFQVGRYCERMYTLFLFLQPDNGSICLQHLSHLLREFSNTTVLSYQFKVLL
ncbi:hypothetical protein DSM109990_03866 (plasmid) [Sulfitobacter dubius]|uniref:Uncharacterized protein n=1 Tax=Sulfitobacter dubius TaxID=218673 RepID=A0ABY3ZR75_9RHOB|nr:hypothetical protein DSM109990_03866 [Sulfitobacter dubius]